MESSTHACVVIVSYTLYIIIHLSAMQLQLLIFVIVWCITSRGCFYILLLRTQPILSIYFQDDHRSKSQQFSSLYNIISRSAPKSYFFHLQFQLCKYQSAVYEIADLCSVFYYEGLDDREQQHEAFNVKTLFCR